MTCQVRLVDGETLPRMMGFYTDGVPWTYFIDEYSSRQRMTCYTVSSMSLRDAS